MEKKKKQKVRAIRLLIQRVGFFNLYETVKKYVERNVIITLSKKVTISKSKVWKPKIPV